MTRQKYVRPLTSHLREFLGAYGPDLCGTAAIPARFPEAFKASGVKARNPEWNWFRGTTVSHPTQHEYLIGFAYLDLKTNQPDEDLYRADLLALDLRYFPRGTYERVNRAYVGTHHGAKPYLPTVLDPIE